MQKVTGVGLGLRRELVRDLLASPTSGIDFLELAPENWLPFGGALKKQLAALAERYPLICHGLSLNIGGADPLNESFLSQLAQFFQQVPVRVYSEHLSFTAAGGQLFDLLPLPFRQEAITHVVSRIQQVQDRLQRRLVLENVSYYSAWASEMSELEFLLEVVKRADCDLLLDVNNVYVNSINHHGDARAFIQALPTERIRYLHIAGHLQQADDFLIDTHGSDVADPVWQLLRHTYQCHGVLPTLLERDFNIPSLGDLQRELSIIRQVQQTSQVKVA